MLRLSGYVMDRFGSAVASAKVVLKNTSTGVTRTAEPNGTGSYLFTYVLPAQYYGLSVDPPGLSVAGTPGYWVETAQSVRTYFPLQVGQTQQEITLTSGAQLVQTGLPFDYEVR